MDNRLSDMHLVLFFTRGISLRAWDKMGMFEREVVFYRRLQEHGAQVSFVTYGDGRDLDYAERIPGIRILCNRWGLPNRYYERWLPWLHAPWLRAADIIKTNQMKGAEVALRAARRWGKPLIARCGYMWSDLAAHSGTERIGEAEQARQIEDLVLKAADRVVVTTPAMANYAVRQYGLPESKVKVIPNYVLTDLFSPGGVNSIPNRLCFIGRLEAQKNPLTLIEACTGLDVELVMVGDGPLREAIEQKANRIGAKVQLLGNQPHARLPDILRQSSLFLLVSPHEGHPKALLEAMACGLPVIGADTPGIREVIKHRETGYLCGTTPVEIRQAIVEVMGDQELRAKMGRQARQFVVEHLSLHRILNIELDLLESLRPSPKQKKGEW